MTALAALLALVAAEPGALEAGPPALPDLEPGSLGPLVSVGRVFPRQGPGASPTFVYQRHRRETDAGSVTTCVTRQGGEVVLVDVAEAGPDHALRRFTAHQLQTGEVGQAEVRGAVVEFRLEGPGGTRTAREEVRSPVVVGPTLYEFVARHWARLLAGDPVSLRFAVVGRLETIGFDLVRVEAPPGQVRVELRASSFLVALVVEPMVITYTPEGRLLAFDGRTPMKVLRSGRWADFEGHVDYQLAAPGRGGSGEASVTASPRRPPPRRPPPARRPRSHPDP